MISIEKIKHYFEYLYEKAQKTPHRFIHHNGFDIKSLFSQKEDYCKWLYQQYQKNEFEFSVLKRKRVLASGKERWIFQYPLPDLIIHYCIADFIQRKTKSFDSENLFSYKKGKNSDQALHLVDQYIRKYRKSRKLDLKCTGLFIIRKDISKFSDSIPSGEGSILWDMLIPLLAETSAQDLRLIRESLNPSYINDTDDPNTKPQLLNHLPMGSPTVGFLTNFYLHQLDAQISKIKESLYLRFGDDILFITPKYDVCSAVETSISDHCKKMNLSFNVKKSYTTYLTAPGRPYPSAGILRNSTNFEYLGMKIDFNEGLGLTNEKYKKLFANFRQLIHNYKTNLKNLNLIENEFYNEQQYQVLIKEINQLLVLNSDKNILYLDKIMKNISSHKILKKIDLDIAYEILKSTKNINSKKVFRENGYEALRERYKLRSLVKYKNEYTS